MRGSKTGFADLKRLHEQAQEGLRLARVQEARQLAAAEAAKATRAAMAAGKSGARQQDEDPAKTALAFQQAMKAVKPIQAPARRVHDHRPDPMAVPAHRRAAALGETAPRADGGVSDGGDLAPLLSEGGTAFVRHDAAPDTARKLRRGQWRVGAELDLHGLRVEQARHALLAFLDECLEHGIRCIRVVHGKGYGSQGLEPVLKDKVRTWLVQKSDVMAFSETPEREGGAGALLVLLRQGEGGRR